MEAEPVVSSIRPHSRHDSRSIAYFSVSLAEAAVTHQEHYVTPPFFLVVAAPESEVPPAVNWCAQGVTWGHP